MTFSVRRWKRPAATLGALVAALSLVVTPAGPALAEAPSPTPKPTPANEGGTPLLRDVIERTSRAFVEAKTRVAESRKKQLEHTLALDKAERTRAALTPQVAEIARQSYRVGRIGPALALLNSGSSDDFLRRAESLEMLTLYDNQRLSDLNNALEAAVQAKALLDLEVKKEQAQLAVMAKQKTEANEAFKVTGGKITNGWVNATSPVARQSPRNSDGSWSSQSCSQGDPTTSGCITPRMLFALKETQRLGFKRFVSCYRSGGPYEHPKGRACDFSAFKSNFGSGDAMGDARFYGTNLAAFFVRNADRLGVLYVIWYRQIWMPATGWHSYGGAYGDPSSDHTNHVHLSVL
jgi:hypothetical protein